MRLSVWKNVWQRCAQNFDRMVTASLRFRGDAEDWGSLSKQWKKKYVLAILSCTQNDGKLPRVLREDNRDWWFKYAPRREIPDSIWKDNDVFRARLRRKDFQK